MASLSHSSAEPRGAGAAPARRQWRVRSEKGETFGPADLDTLKSWARDGRLAPSHLISDDGHSWVPVTTLTDLSMDWVAEVTTGSFYGPIHVDALAELVREGAISAAAPTFRRSSPKDQSAIEREQALEARLLEVQQQLYARLGDLEAQLGAAQGELDQSRSLVSAKDLEFDAERQEQKAAGARLQAELLKREGRIAALEKDVQRFETAARDRQAIEPRLAEAERQAADGRRQADALRHDLEQARAAQREAERNLALLRERVAHQDRESAALKESARTLKLRLDSARKLLQQAAKAVEETEEVTDAEVIDAVAPAATDGPPPHATPPAGGVKPGMSLADLEAQAQRELRQLRGKGAGIFKTAGAAREGRGN